MCTITVPVFGVKDQHHSNERVLINVLKTNQEDMRVSDFFVKEYHKIREKIIKDDHASYGSNNKKLYEDIQRYVKMLNTKNGHRFIVYSESPIISDMINGKSYEDYENEMGSNHEKITKELDKIKTYFLYLNYFKDGTKEEKESVVKQGRKDYHVISKRDYKRIKEIQEKLINSKELPDHQLYGLLQEMAYLRFINYLPIHGNDIRKTDGPTENDALSYLYYYMRTFKSYDEVNPDDPKTTFHGEDLRSLMEKAVDDMTQGKNKLEPIPDKNVEKRYLKIIKEGQMERDHAAATSHTKTDTDANAKSKSKSKTKYGTFESSNRSERKGNRWTEVKGKMSRVLQTFNPKTQYRRLNGNNEDDTTDNFYSKKDGVERFDEELDEAP